MFYDSTALTPRMIGAIRKFLNDPRGGDHKVGDTFTKGLKQGDEIAVERGMIEVHVEDKHNVYHRTISGDGFVHIEDQKCEPPPLKPKISLNILDGSVGIGVNFGSGPVCSRPSNEEFVISSEKVAILRGALFGFDKAGVYPTPVVQAQAQSLRKAMGL